MTGLVGSQWGNRVSQPKSNFCPDKRMRYTGSGPRFLPQPTVVVQCDWFGFFRGHASKNVRQQVVVRKPYVLAPFLLVTHRKTTRSRDDHFGRCSLKIIMLT